MFVYQNKYPFLVYQSIKASLRIILHSSGYSRRLQPLDQMFQQLLSSVSVSTAHSSKEVERVEIPSSLQFHNTRYDQFSSTNILTQISLLLHTKHVNRNELSVYYGTLCHTMHVPIVRNTMYRQNLVVIAKVSIVSNSWYCSQQLLCAAHRSILAVIV